MSQQQLTLHHYWRSSCSWRVRWALEYKKIPYGKKHVNLLKAEQKEEAYLKINPSGYVPALLIQGQYYGESLALLEWLDEKYPNPPLLPGASEDKLYVRILAQNIASGTQPLQNLVAQQKHSEDPEERKIWAKFWNERGLAVLEKLIRPGPHGSFCFRDQLTIADLCLVPQVYNAKRYDVDISAYPTVEKIYNRCLQEPTCKSSAPEAQTEAT